MKTSRSILAVLCSLAVVCSAQATTVIPPTFDELVAEAELIFQGTVTDVTSQWTGEGGQRHIVSYVTVRVEDAIKGNPGVTYTLRMLGGTVDGQTMEVSDSPKFKPGDREILFVQNNGRQFIPLVGIMHGRFRVQKDEQSGADIVVSNEGRPVGDLAQLGKAAPHSGTAFPDANTTTRALGADEFKSAIRAKLSGG
jgi:hypothetical protein